MGVASSKSKPKTVSLIESCAAGTGTVDRERRVIKGVKILGRTSPNTHGMAGISGTEYSDAAMERAKALYEGRQSFVDHPTPRGNPGVERSTRDLVGVHRNVRREPDGLYSDFHYRSTHSYIADDAEQMPDALGFSHNATGSGHVVNGKYIVESIDRVRSIDLVTRPATTRGLYESEAPTMTLKDKIDELKLGERVTKQLLEMDGFGGDALTAPPPETETATGYMDHLGEAIKAVLSDESLDMAAKKTKIMAILKATDEKVADDPVIDPPADDKPEKTEKEKDTEESLRAEVAVLKADIAVRDLCESKGFKPTKVQRKSLMLLEQAERLEFIADATATPGSTSAPRSQSSRNFQESRQTEPKDAKSFAAALLN